MWLIIMREFSERARKKSFIVTTLLMPLFMVALMIAPSLVMLYGTSEQKRVVVVDRSGWVADELVSTPEVMFERSDMSKREVCSTYGEDSGVFGILYIVARLSTPTRCSLLQTSRRR